jgi:peptidoglycan-associated lipoprotein
MRKFLLFLGLIALFFTACSKKMPVAIPGSTSTAGAIIEDGSLNPETGSINSRVDNDNISTQTKNGFVQGAIDSNGKYTGNEGVSKSGINILYFATDSYTLEDDQIKRLMQDIPKVKKYTTQGKVIVEGNCDEFGTDEYNHALGLKRAKAVKKLLISAGIPSNKIDTVSYGESNPVCTVNKPACHAKNRRAEINKI